jgi:hypothetical protein
VAEQMQNVEPLREIFDPMFALLESLETQNIAVVQFLKVEGIAADDKLAPYLERAGKCEQREMARGAGEDGALAYANSSGGETNCGDTQAGEDIQREYWHGER